MRRKTAFMVLAGAAAVIAMPSTASAQVSVGVHLYWVWNDGGWRSHRVDWDGRRGEYRLDRQGRWIAAAYMPPRGFCREWIPGIPAWEQPLPVPCERLFLGYGVRRGAIILGSAGFIGPSARVVRMARDAWRERMERDAWRDRVDRDGRVRYVAPPRRDDDGRWAHRGRGQERGRARNEDRGRGRRDHDRRDRDGRGGG